MRIANPGGTVMRCDASSVGGSESAEGVGEGRVGDGVGGRDRVGGGVGEGLG